MSDPGAAATKRNLLMQSLRAIWVVGAFGFLGYFLITRWPEATTLLASLEPWQPIAAFALLCAGKLIYVEIVRRTLAATGGRGDYGFAFYAYSLSQLGKYIPGSVWQFVGRFDIYRQAGVAAPLAMRLILLENLVMLGVAGLVALGAAPVLLALLTRWIAAPWLAALIGGGVLAAAAALRFAPGLMARVRAAVETGWRRRGLIVMMAVLFAAMWVVLGLSAYAIVARAPVNAPGFPQFVVSLFALSYIVGFVALFAPAGVGVREIVFTLGLASYTGAEAALLIALGHRLLYVLADVIMGVGAWAGGGAIAKTAPAAPQDETR